MYILPCDIHGSMKMVVLLFYEDESLLHQLMEHLQTKYEGSDPDYEASWTVGQSVIVRYTQDEQFYRAKITDVVDEGIKVRNNNCSPCYFSLQSYLIMVANRAAHQYYI